MSTSEPELEIVVAEQLRSLRRSVTRIEAHRAVLASIPPIDAIELGGLGDTDLVRVKALMKKFEHFVDDLRRLARGLLPLSAEDVGGKSHRQLLDRLASLGAIASAEAVMALISLRNRLTHDYPSAPDKQAAILNALCETSAELSPLFDRIEAFVSQSGLLPTPDS